MATALATLLDSMATWPASAWASSGLIAKATAPMPSKSLTKMMCFGWAGPLERPAPLPAPGWGNGAFGHYSNVGGGYKNTASGAAACVVRTIAECR